MKARKSLLCVVVCIVMVVCMTSSVMAESDTFTFNGKTATGELVIAAKKVSGATYTNYSSCTVTVSITAVYTDSSGNLHSTGTGNGAYGYSCSASIYLPSGGVTFAYASSTHTATDGIGSNEMYLYDSII